MAQFYYGQLDYVEKLNVLYDVFSAGPYNSLPLTGGSMTGALLSNSLISTTTGVSVGLDRGYLSERVIDSAPTTEYQRWSGSAELYYGARVTMSGGTFNFQTSILQTRAGQNFKNALSLTPSGDAIVAQLVHAGPTTINRACHQFFVDAAQGGELAYFGRSANAAPCVAIAGSDGAGGWASVPSVLYVGKNPISLRSATMGGGIYGNGSDGAEYLTKGPDCGLIAKGSVVGITADGLLTDKWDLAIAFAVKSTDPAWIGGDTWSQCAGQPPSAVTRAPDSHDDAGKLVMGESDAAWAARLAAFEIAQAEFDTALEAARQTVDRIAFWGRVPVNVLGATPGQYIVPVQDGEGISGTAINEDDITLKEYMRALGKVISVEHDGRARIIVKVA